jgi:hypothetical protein
VEGLFADPDELVTEICQPGSIKDFEANGRWFLEQENLSAFSGNGPVAFETSCESGLRVQVGGVSDMVDVPDAVQTDDYLFWRRERVFESFELTIVDAHLICGVDAEGRYVGQTVRCSQNGEEEPFCEQVGVSMTPFGRLSGEVEAPGLELLSEFSGQAWSWRRHFTANVRVQDDHAYVVIDDGGLRIVEISDLRSPKEVGIYAAHEGEGFNDLKLVSDESGVLYALLGSSARGMVVVDVSDPRRPVEVVSVTPNGGVVEGVHTLFTEVIEGKTMAYLADGISNVTTIWDVSNPRVPIRLGAHVSADSRWAVHDLYAKDGRLYLNATLGGMIVVDTQPDPANPVEIGRFAPEVGYSHSNWVTTIEGKRYSVHGDEGYDAHFKIVDVEPASATFMQEVGKYQTRPQVSAHNVMAFGNKAYAAYYQDGVRIFDLSDPTNPTLAAYFNTWDPVRSPGGRFEGAVGLDVDVEAGLIYVADHPRGLMILSEL